MYNNWTRISTNEDFYDVIESFKHITDNLNRPFILLTLITDKKIYIKTSSIVAYFESGIENLIKLHERNQEIEQLMKENIKQSWE